MTASKHGIPLSTVGTSLKKQKSKEAQEEHGESIEEWKQVDDNAMARLLMDTRYFLSSGSMTTQL